ncbi:MAG: thiamine pyrophosphate-dependent enzyme [Candidatus Helarchaeota archaeon]
MAIEDLLIDEPGRILLLEGNHAMARAVLEAGVGFSSTYPGTPASEIGDILAKVGPKIPNFYSEYSVNEAVALEGAAGASWAGIRALCTMKHVGLNVASDALHTIAQTGVKGGLVLIMASDAGAYSSQSEQDNRWFSYHTFMPWIEPSTLQEAKDFIVSAFDLSEKYDVPVIVCPSSRICHGMGKIELKPFKKIPEKGKFVSDMTKYANATFFSVEHKKNLLKRIKKLSRNHLKGKLQKEIGFDYNKILEGDSKTGFITTGVSFGYTLEALEQLKIFDVPILRLGLLYPINDNLIIKFIEDRGLEKLIVVEELMPFIENRLKEIFFDAGIKIELHGKDTFPDYHELNIDIVRDHLAKLLNVETPAKIKNIQKIAKKAFTQAPRRDPTWCPGCPHRATFYTLKKVTRDQGVYGCDIGCYAMAIKPPMNMGHWIICMGAGLGVAEGMAHKTDQQVFASIGDSTFFHSGMQGMLNAIYNDSNMTLLVLENKWTSMTGQQPTQTTGLDSHLQPIQPVNIATLAKSMGAKYVRTVDPYNVRSLQTTLIDAMSRKGFKIVVCSRECALQADRTKRKKLSAITRPLPKVIYQIDPERCQKCKECISILGCPAITKGKNEEGEEYYYIETARCTNCGVCYEICPNSAITKTEINLHLEGID